MFDGRTRCNCERAVDGKARHPARFLPSRLTRVTLAAMQVIAAMDKKAKKKIDVLHQRLQQLRQKLAGAKTQLDDPDEVRRLEKDVAAAEAEIAKLKTA